MAICERELWACASQVQRSHGEGALAFISDRITALARAGDMEGVATWGAIAERLDQLLQTDATRQ